MIVVATLFIVANLQFFIFQVINPIDPVRLVIGPGFTIETRDMLRRLWGLDKPLSERYLIYLINLFTFQFGISFISRRPVIMDIIQYLPNTLILLVSAFALEVLTGIIAGLIAVMKFESKIDVLIVALGLISWALPAFIFQLTFRFVFSFWAGWFPWGGMTSIPPPTNTYEYIMDFLWHLTLPLITLVLMGFGGWAFYTRNLLVDVMAQDYIITARAKGLKERTIVINHAFRAILPPIVTMILLTIPGLITGSVITEYIFSWPGIGSWLIRAIEAGDYPTIQALFFLYSILLLLSNFVADLLYGILDPRIRVGVRR